MAQEVGDDLVTTCVQGSDATGAAMVNRYPAACGQVPKVQLTAMQFAC